MSISREVLGKYIKRGDLFVETGARWADTSIRAVELGAHFAETCEIDPLMASIAQLHANDATKGNYVRVSAIPSVKMLLECGLDTLHRNEAETVVYLDAHTESSSPVLEELRAIKSWRSKPRVILIDDIKLMAGWGVDYAGLYKMLMDMGYRVHYEDGVRPEDIMVGIAR